MLESIRNDRKDAVIHLLGSFNPVDLHQLLVANWSVLFETTKVKRTGKSITTFSELTESYLLPASITSQTIRSALLATFRNLLIDTNVLNIEVVLKLFMDFLAAHFGRISLYMSVQSILEDLLEAYFHRLYVIRRYSDTLSSASHEVLTKDAAELHSVNNNDSLASTSSGNASASFALNSSGRLNDSIQSEAKDSYGGSTARKHPHNLFTSSFNVEALKILTRIYLSSLKAYTVEFDISTTKKATYLKYIKFMRENLNRVYAHHISQNANCDEKSSAIDESKFCTEPGQIIGNDGKFQASEIRMSKIPILFLLQRPGYLNSMTPIKDVNAAETDIVSHASKIIKVACSTGRGRKAVGIILKLQALLSSGILTRDILQEVLHFIETNVPFVGVDSFLTLLMPFEMCIEFLIEMRPEYILEYGKSVISDDQKWQYLLTHITMQFDRIAKNRSQAFYEKLLKGKDF